MMDIKQDEEIQELLKRFPKCMQRFTTFIHNEAKKEVFDDKFIEALLCTCDGIDKIKLKDADKLAKHKKECAYVISRQKHLGTHSKKNS